MNTIVPISHSYLVGSLLFIPFFAAFMVLRKDLRSIMLVSGLIGIIFGCATEYFLYGHDWWHAERVIKFFGGRLGFEDVLYSFLHGGLLTVTGLVCLRSKLDTDTTPGSGFIKRFLLRGIQMAFIVVLLMFVMIKFLGIPSFYGAATSFGITSLFIIYKRPDLIWLSISGGTGTLVWALLVYLAMNFLSPGWIESFWINNTEKIRFLGIPLLDILWYFAVGFCSSVLIPFLTERKVIPLTD